MLKVIEMGSREAKGALSEAKRRWLRHQANNLVAQLPEDEDEALYVLEHARRLVIEFLREGPDSRPHIVGEDD